MTIFRYLSLIPALIAVFGKFSFAQEMEPRAYSRAPVGTQTVIFTYGHQSGDVFTDSALPLTDVSIALNSFSVGYARTLGLAGRQTAEVCDLDDVRVRDGGRCLRFAGESHPEVAVAGKIRTEDLKRERSLQDSVADPINRTYAAFASTSCTS